MSSSGQSWCDKMRNTTDFFLSHRASSSVQSSSGRDVLKEEVGPRGKPAVAHRAKTEGRAKSKTVGKGVWEGI